MYNNVGREIKGWATGLLILMIILCVISGIGIFVMIVAMDEDLILLAFFLAALQIGLGYVLARFSAMFMYAYGQLVESVDAIKDTLNVMRASGSNQSKHIPAAPQTPPPAPASNVWFCGTCGERNEGNTLLCKRCNTPR